MLAVVDATTPATSADAPADDSSEVKSEDLPTAASVSAAQEFAIMDRTSTTNYQYKNSLIDLQMQKLKIMTDYQRLVSGFAKDIGSTAPDTLTYLEQAVENSSVTVLSTITQLVGMDNFLSLTASALAHGYDSCASSFDQLKALLNSMRLNSLRVDVAYVYNVHHGRTSPFSNWSIEDVLEHRREERIEQSRYPLSLFGFQLMELIKILDTSMFAPIIIKYSSMLPGQVTESTILAAEDEIRKATSGLKDVRVTYDQPTRSRHAPTTRRVPIPAAAIHQGPTSTGESNFGQSSGGKHPYQPSAGRYAQRSQQHGPPHRSQQPHRLPQPHRPQQRSDESSRSTRPATYVRFEDTEPGGDSGGRAGDGGSRGGAGGGRGGRSSRSFNYAGHVTSRHRSPDHYSQEPQQQSYYAPPEPYYYPMYVPPQSYYAAPQEPFAAHNAHLSAEQLNFITPYLSPAQPQQQASSPPVQSQLDDPPPAQPQLDNSLSAPTAVMMVNVLPQPPDQDEDLSPPTFNRLEESLHFRRQEARFGRVYFFNADVALRFHSTSPSVGHNLRSKNPKRSYTLIVDSGSPKNLFPIHMLSNLKKHSEWICGVGKRTLYSPCTGTVRLLVRDPSDPERSIIIEVDAWGLYDRDVGPHFSPPLSLASIVRAGVGFSHTRQDGPLLIFPDGTELLLRCDYTLHACMVDADPPVPVPAPGNA